MFAEKCDDVVGFVIHATFTMTQNMREKELYFEFT